jgi:DNA repair exonuclease SbcCD ATPase subunit
MHSAEWLGRMVGFLSGPGTSADNTAPVAETAAAIDGILTGERKLAYERTRKSISKRQKDLETLASRPIAEVISEAKAKRQEARESLETAEADIKRIEEEIRTVRKPFEQQIAEAKLEIRANGQKVSNASKELPDAQEKVEELSVPRQYPNGYVRSYRNVPVGVRTRNETGQERKSRESQLAAAQQRLQTLKSTIDNAQQNMSEVRKQTETAQSEMRSAIAAIQPKLREARQKSQECAAQLKELEHETLTPEHVKSRVTALNSYVPFDTLREKDRLLATLKSAND